MCYSFTALLSAENSCPSCFILTAAKIYITNIYNILTIFVALNLFTLSCRPHHRPSPECFYLPHLKFCSHETLTSNHHLTSCLFEFALLGASGEGDGTSLQYSCLEIPMDGGAWWAAVHGVAKSWTRLRDFLFTFMHWRRKWQPTPSVLAWRTPGTGESGGLPSMGSHRVGHD